MPQDGYQCCTSAPTKPVTSEPDLALCKPAFWKQPCLDPVELWLDLADLAYLMLTQPSVSTLTKKNLEV